MDPADRICEEFERLSKHGREQVSALPFADQIVYLVVVSRCEKDIGGFESVFEQGLTSAELDLLVSGLQRMNETDFAKQFSRVSELLKQNGFYTRHGRNLERVPEKVKMEVSSIELEIGDRLWELDAKLVELLDSKV